MSLHFVWYLTYGPPIKCIYLGEDEHDDKYCYAAPIFDRSFIMRILKCRIQGG